MTIAIRFGWIRLPVLVAGIGMASCFGRGAALRGPCINPWPEDKPAEAADDAADVDDPTLPRDDVMKGIDVNKLDWSLLNGGRFAHRDAEAQEGRTAPKSTAGNDAAWSTDRKAERLLRRVGQAVAFAVLGYADRRRHDGGRARAPLTASRAVVGDGSPMAAAAPQSSGTAWAAITAPGVASIWDKTSVEARVDPGTEQSKLGTSLSKSVPLSERLFADPAERLQFDPAGRRAGARHRQPSLAQLRDRAVGETQHQRHRHQLHGRPDTCRPPTTNGCARSAPSKNCSTASPSRARSARPPTRRHQQEH